MKKIDAFKRDYHKLLKKHGVTVAGVPRYIPQADGSWVLAIGLEVYETRAQEEADREGKPE